MSAALAYLVALVESGVEYPDAEYQAAKKYQVPADELRADYDRRSALGLAKQIRDSQDEEERAYQELRAAWQLGDYVGACPNCGRSRLCQCPNGKRRCEKCNWCPEDGAYAPDV